MADKDEGKTVNGVDVGKLSQTVQAIADNPKLGAFRFRARNVWLGCGRNRTEIQGFYGAGKEDDTRSRPYVLENDEPIVLLGTDQAANPVEQLLHALAGCLTTTMALHAAARGIEIQSIESHLEGEIDVRGFLGLANDVPKGYRGIRVTFRVVSDAPTEKLAELAKYSPVYNTILNPTPVEVVIEKAQRQAA